MNMVRESDLIMGLTPLQFVITTLVTVNLLALVPELFIPNSPGVGLPLGFRAQSRVGDLVSSPRQRGIYHHWLVVVAVNDAGEATEVLDFDPYEQNFTDQDVKPSFRSTILGHLTVPRHLVRDISSEEFSRALHGCTLR